MRKRLSLLVTGVLVAGGVTVGTASPAYACHELGASSDDPIYQFTCDVVHSAPEPGPTIQYYYWKVGETAYDVYCKLWPPCR